MPSLSASNYENLNKCCEKKKYIENTYRVKHISLTVKSNASEVPIE